LNICIFASGGGSNFKAILDAKKNNIFKSDIRLLITNNSGCGALSIAKENHIPYFHISRKKYPDLSDLDYANLFIDKLNEYEIDFIVLAGYMKKIEKPVLEKFENKIINIHPALLPSFGGEGMYGINVHRAVIESKEKKSGITIHLVNDEYDKGKILFQKEIEVSEDDNELTLQKKVLELEHKYYSLIIKNFEEGKYNLL